MWTERQKMFIAVVLFIGLAVGLAEQVGERIGLW